MNRFMTRRGVSAAAPARRAGPTASPTARRTARPTAVPTAAVSSLALAAAGGLLCAAPALAQEVFPLAPIDVYGGLSEISTDRIGRSVTVVGPQELEDLQVDYGADALRGLPGVEVSRSGAPGGMTQVRLRGAEANHTKVLIDGIDASDPSSGEYDFSDLLTADIESFQVFRGPQSAMFGANAIGGAIVIDTIAATEPGLHVGGKVETGTDATGAVQAHIRGRYDIGAFSLSAARRETEGFNAARIHDGEKDGDRNLTLNARGELYVTDEITLDGTARYVDRHSDTDGYFFGAPTDKETVYDDASAHDRQTLWLGLGAAGDFGRFAPEARVSWMQADDQNTLNKAETTNNTGTRLTARAQTGIALDTADFATADHKITLMAETIRETYVANKAALVSDPSQLDEQSRERNGFAAEYQGFLPYGFALQAGVRQDINNDFDDSTTWNVGASWQVMETGVRLHGSAGSGVQVPTMFEQFGYVPDKWKGNPNLKPEESVGFDIGVEYVFWASRAKIDVTYFNQNLTDEIGTEYDAAGIGTPVNQDGTSHRQGVEVAASLQATPSLLFGLAYTYLDATDPDDQVEIRRPRHEGLVQATYSFLGERASVSAFLRYVAGNEDVSYAAPTLYQRVKLDDYATLDITGRYALTDEVAVYARVENLFDTDYTEVLGYNTPGIRAYVGLRAEF